MKTNLFLNLLLLLSVHWYLFGIVLAKFDIQLFETGKSYNDAKEKCKEKNLTLLPSEFNRTLLQASLTDQKLSIHDMNFWTSGRCSWKSRASRKSIVFNGLASEIPEYLAFDPHNDGTKNCLAVVCNYGCNLTDQNCDEHLRRTCSDNLRKTSSWCKQDLHLHWLHCYNSVHPIKKVGLCYSKESFSWNQTADYDCNLKSDAEIDNTIYVLKQLHDRDKYTPILPKEDHNMYYWIGDSHYTCDTGETLPRDFNIDNDDCYHHTVRTEESKPGGITIQDPKASNCASKTAKLVICVDNSTDDTVTTNDSDNIISWSLGSVGGVAIICTIVGSAWNWKRRRREYEQIPGRDEPDKPNDPALRTVLGSIDPISERLPTYYNSTSNGATST